jgi:RNA polymerase sigma factor for flagellar operon FliA
MSDPPRSSQTLHRTKTSAPVANEQVLLARYAPLVRRIAADLQSMKPVLLDSADVIQDGMIGLLRAIRTNRKETEGAGFTAYIRSNVRGAIIDGYRTAGNISRTDYAEARKTVKAMAEGRPVGANEKIKAERVMSMAWQPAASIADDTCRDAALIDPNPGPEQRMMSNELLRRAVDALQEMPVRDRSIFIACELAGDKHAQVAARFNLSGGRISQIVKNVRRSVLAAIA